MMSERKLLIADCQVFQEPAWHRGMGKYSLALLAQLATNKDFQKEYDLKLLLNENLKTDESMLQEVKQHIEDTEILFVKLPTYKEGLSLAEVQKKCQKDIDSYIGSKFQDTDITFVIMSLFLQFACPVYPKNSKKVLLYYDLIMLQYFNLYLGLGPSEQHFAHYRTLLSSDVILSISKTVANDLTLYLGIDPQGISNIDGAPIKRKEIKPEKPELKIDGKYLLMPSGGDPRKNNLRAVQGFDDFNKTAGNKYKLVLTSMFGEGLKKQLEGVCSNIIFSGNVKEAELAWLYKNCEGVLFAPEYEGLGMPILEAADYGKPVACSDISVFREMSTSAFYFFDHESPRDIARALREMINAECFTQKKKVYASILDNYTWEKTAQKTLETLKAVSRKTRLPKKVALVAPNLQTSSYAGYLAAQHYTNMLSKYQDVHLYYDFGASKGPVRPNHLAFATEVRSVADLDIDTAKQYDDISYYLQESDSPMLLFTKALSIHGEVLLYSTSLKRLYSSMVDSGFMSRERYLLEQEISTKLGNDSFMGTLLMSAKSVSVDKANAKRIRSFMPSSKRISPDTERAVTLPSLPYDISLPESNRKTTLYIASSCRLLHNDWLYGMEDEDINILFGSAVPESVKNEILLKLDFVSVSESATDFQLVGKIQKSRKLIILSNEYDAEVSFIIARCRQLSVDYEEFIDVDEVEHE
jgi:glycosyltransferase involved in cell wall biosynthesis